MPAGLLIATPQGLAKLTSRGNAAAKGASVTGGGSTAYFHFGFTAQPHRNGSVAGTVSGNAEIVSPNGAGGHIDLNCLEVVGKDA